MRAARRKTALCVGALGVNALCVRDLRGGNESPHRCGWGERRRDRTRRNRRQCRCPGPCACAWPDDTAGTADDWRNLVERFIGTYAYSYVFDGQAGYLDHALSSPSLVGKVTGADDWHINADEPIALDYNTEFKTDDRYAPTPFRKAPLSKRRAGCPEHRGWSETVIPDSIRDSSSRT